MLVSTLLAQLLGIEHGFGTRSSPLSQQGMASLKQIHSGVCLVVGAAVGDAGGCVGEGDALVTNRAEVAVSVRTADCYPVLLADPVTRSIGAVHAGWRGTAAGVVWEAIARMRDEFGARPEDLWAAIGPGIGGCCYEVGEEVARELGQTGTAAGPRRIDLAAINRRQLLEAGLIAERIDSLNLCTFCEAERFHSYRRDKGAAGRMISYIRLR